jgi:beta-xylosidase
VEQFGYHYAGAGIATSDKPVGSFVFLKTIRPITNDFNFPADDPNGQKQFGATFRDMNLFVDDDGRAYVFYAAEGNWTMYVVRLDKDFTGPETPTVENKTWARILVGAHREAPAPFKFRGRYYLITSACTGWAPNAADCAVAKNILGPYQSLGNPCVGTNADTTFGTQSTFVLPMPGRPEKFIFMADQWKPQELSDSRYVWLPLILKTGSTFMLQWQDRWNLSSFKPTSKWLKPQNDGANP